MLAADMRTGLPALVADGVDQRLARLDADRIVAAVDIERDVDFSAIGAPALHGASLRELRASVIGPLVRGA
jgi:hypothetical protein